LSHVRSPTLRSEFERISSSLADALEFSSTVGAGDGQPYEAGGGRGVLGEVDFYTSHEGLMLPYEQALTRLLPVPHSLRTPSQLETDVPKAYYNTSAHFLWIGDRTRQLTGAHV